jgi:hypothetical protein
MVSQVKIVSILMIVNGALVVLVGLIFSVGGPLVLAMVRSTGHGPRDPDERMAMEIAWYVYLVIGIPTVLVGIVTMIAGVRALLFRGRIMALVALFLNIIPMCTMYCAPTSLGLLIYGLIVFFHADVARAFQMVAEGVPAAEVEARFLKERLGERWGDDWDEDDYPDVRR